MPAADPSPPSPQAVKPLAVGPRPRALAVRGAAATLWLPTLLPVLTGQLRECSHCLTTYLVSLPVVPGVVAAALLRCDGAMFFVVSGAVAAALLLLVYWLWRELPRGVLIAAAAVVVIAIGAEAFAFAMALRA